MTEPDAAAMTGAGKLDRRYLVVFGACLTQFMVIGLLFSYGVLFKVFEDEFGWSRTFLSSCTSLAFLIMGILAIFGGRLNDRYGPRMVLSVSGTLFGLGFAMIALVTEQWHLVAIFGIFIGLGMSTHDVVTLSTIARWFDKRRGIMTGVVKVGTAAGQVVLPPLTAFLVVWLGWRSAVVALGVAAVVLLVVGALSMRSPPKPAGSGTNIRLSGLSFGEARRTRSFWTFCAIQLLFFPVLTTLPLHIVVHGMDLGMTAPVAAILLSVIGAASVVGRLTVGAFSDRIGGKRAYAMCFAPLIGALISLVFLDAHWALFVVIAIYGFAHGGFFTVVSPTVAEYFGTRGHGAIFGAILFFGTIGGALGPILAGRVFDVTGSYALAFSGLAGFAILGLLLVFSLPAPLREADV